MDKTRGGPGGLLTTGLRRPALNAVGVLVVVVLVVIVGGAVTPVRTGWLLITAALVAGVMLLLEWLVFSWLERRS